MQIRHRGSNLPVLFVILSVFGFNVQFEEKNGELANPHKYTVDNKNTIDPNPGVQISMVFSYGGERGIRTLVRV